MTDQTPSVWVRVATPSDITDDSTYRVEVGGIGICLARSRGQLHAVQDRCSHEDVPLSEGEVDDGAVECWLHGSRFDLATGRALNPPAIKPVPVYPVREEGTDVLLDVTLGNHRR